MVLVFQQTYGFIILSAQLFFNKTFNLLKTGV